MVAEACLVRPYKQRWVDLAAPGVLVSLGWTADCTRLHFNSVEPMLTPLYQQS